jgi:hypothetical protein
MRRAMTCFPLLSVLVFAAAAAAQTPANLKATAPDKMMPADKAAKMRACDKLAMDQHVKMEDRAEFVAKCVAGKTPQK